MTNRDSLELIESILKIVIIMLRDVKCEDAAEQFGFDELSMAVSNAENQSFRLRYKIDCRQAEMQDGEQKK